MTTVDKLPGFQMLHEILVRRGLAVSPKEAQAIIRAGKVLVRGVMITDPRETFIFNAPIKLTGSSKPSSDTPRRMSRFEFAQRAAATASVVTFDPSKKPADRPAAKSGNARPSCEDDDDARELPSARADVRLIGQVDLEELICRQNELGNLQERIAVALSKSALIERGVHTAELVPTRDNGHVYLKLVIR